MPNRQLREQLRTSEKVMDLTDAEFRLFVLLLTCADDYGRFHGNPKLVTSACYPFGGKRPADVGQMTVTLATKEMVQLYEVAGKQYIEITQWKQRIRAKASKFPSPVSAQCPSRDGHTSVTCPPITVPNNELRITNNGKDAVGAQPSDKAIEQWNRIAELSGLGSILSLGSNRKTHYQARLKDCPDFWDVLHRELPLLGDFAKGSNDSGWKLSFDFCIKSQDNFNKIAEGTYRQQEKKCKKPRVSSFAV